MRTPVASKKGIRDRSLIRSLVVRRPWPWGTILDGRRFFDVLPMLVRAR